MTQTDDTTATGTDLVSVLNRSSIELTTEDRATLERFLASAETDAETMGADAVTLEVITRILRAETIDDVLDGGGAIHARDVLNVPFTLASVRFNRSTFEGGGPRFYALLNVNDRQGDSHVITCGASKVIAQAWRLRDLDAFPIDLVIKQSERETAAGFKIMWLERPPDSF